MILHVTNGQVAVNLLEQSGIDGVYLAWNDVLHEGPVPSGLGPAAMRDQRAAFLAGGGFGSADDIARDLQRRDEMLEAAMRADEIVLWFEHDLYDQLQLIQILERLPVDTLPRVSAVLTSVYLGHIAANRYVDLFAGRQRISSAQHLAARDAWEAFRSQDPRAIVNALPRVTALPHLAPALLRHLQQFPSTRNGLSRTEQQTLEVVSQGVTHIRDVFVKVSEAEEAIFMGDSPFADHISSLVRSNQPLLRTVEGERLQSFEFLKPETHFVRLEITDAGRRVLAAEADRVTLSGIDRWLGGVHLTGHGPVFRWDDINQTIRFA